MMVLVVAIELTRDVVAVAVRSLKAVAVTDDKIVGVTFTPQT